MSKQNIVFESPKCCVLKLRVFRITEFKKDVNNSLSVLSKILMHPYNRGLFNPLLIFRVQGVKIYLVFSAFTKFSKASDDEMSDLLVFRVARD